MTQTDFPAEVDSLLDLERSYRKQGEQLIRKADRCKRRRLAIDAYIIIREAYKAIKRGSES